MRTAVVWSGTLGVVDHPACEQSDVAQPRGAVVELLDAHVDVPVGRRRRASALMTVNATLGGLTSASLAIHAVGRGLAQAMVP